MIYPCAEVMLTIAIGKATVANTKSQSFLKRIFISP